MVYLFNNQVSLAPTPQVDAFGRLRVSQPQTLFDSQQRFGLDRSFVSNVLTGGSVSYISTQSSANLTVTNTTGSFASRESKYVFKYQPGKSQLSIMTFVMAPLSSGNLRQRIGYFGQDNGFYLELSDQLYLVKRSNVTGTIVNTSVAQSTWNGDTLQGSGLSGITLDMTKAQILFFDMEWLGVGSVRAGFVLNGQFVLAHTFRHSNIVSTAYITTACLPVRYETQSLTGSGPATSNLTQICCTVASEAGYTEPLSLFSNAASFPTASIGTTVWSPVVSLQLNIANGRQDAIVQIRQIDLALTTSDTLQWALWSNVAPGALTGATFTAPPGSNSVLIDSASTALNTTGCYQIAAGIIVSGSKATSLTALDLSSYFSQVGRDSFAKVSEIFTLALIHPPGTGVTAGTASGTALLSWQELL